MRKLLIILFLLVTSLVGATNYYVKTGGNDASAGTSDATAWAHHPWMSTWTGSVTLAAGDIVYMNRGNTWSSSASSHYMTVGQSGSAGNYITTTAYGTGSQPLIRITANVSYCVVFASGRSFLKFDNLHIQHYSSATGSSYKSGIMLYGYSSPCHDIVITNCEIDNIPMYAINSAPNSYNLTIGDTTATSTATTTAYSNHIHHFGYGGIVIFGCEAATLHSHFKVYYNYVHDATKTTAASNEYGISMTVNADSYGHPKYCTVRYNRVENINTWSAVSSHNGSYLYYLDNYIKCFGRSGIAAAGDVIAPLTTVANHIYIERNIIEQTLTGWVSGAQNAFITTMCTTTGNNIYVRDNICFYTSRPTSCIHYGMRFENIDGLTVSGNTFYNGETSSGYAAIYLGDWPGGVSGSKNVTITQNFIKHWSPGINLIGNAVIGPVTITNNIISQPTGNACLTIADANLPATAAVAIYNNVFLAETYGYVFYTGYGITSGGSLIAKNNVFGRVYGGSGYYWYWGGTISGTFTSDYNIYWNSTSASPFWQAGAARNWTYWTTTLGHDTHSPNITANLNPEFTNAGGSYLLDTDFELNVTSPAIDAGVGVGVGTDYFGNTRDADPDIGIFEEGAGVPSIPLPTLSTTTAVYVPPTSATSGGNVTDDGGGTGVTARGVCWATTINPTIASSHTHDGSGEGAFASSVTGLSEDETYYVRAYATNETGTGYGNQVSFSTTTPPVAPTVMTYTISFIHTTTASGGGTVTDDGNSPVTSRGVCWSTSASPTIADSHTNNGSGIGGFSSAITGLVANTLYHVRAYATNSVTTSYGADVEFTTLLTEPETEELVLYFDGKAIFTNGKLTYIIQ